MNMSDVISEQQLCPSKTQSAWNPKWIHTGCTRWSTVINQICFQIFLVLHLYLKTAVLAVIRLLRLSASVGQVEDISACSRREFSSCADLPMRRNSPTSPWRLMAMRMLRTVMPSQKHATTLALGRWARSLSSSRSKLCSPALLQILPEGGKHVRQMQRWEVNLCPSMRVIEPPLCGIFSFSLSNGLRRSLDSEIHCGFLLEYIFLECGGIYFA